MWWTVRILLGRSGSESQIGLKIGELPSTHGMIVLNRRALVLLLTVSSTASSTACTEPGSSEKILGKSVPAGGSLEWLPNSSEIGYRTSFDYPYTGPPAHYRAVSASTGAVRTILPPQASGAVYQYRIASPWVYFDMAGTIHRVDLAGTAAIEAFPVVFPTQVFNWSVSDDHRWIAWADRKVVFRSSLASGATDTVSTDYSLTTWGERTFLSPDGSAILVADWGAEPARVHWIDLETASATTATAPCMLRDGTIMRWENRTPVLYLACGGNFVRFVIGAGAATLASIPNGESGAWSPNLDRVSAWRRSCPRWTGVYCRGATRELYVALVGARPRLVGTLVLDATEHLDDTGPALFSPVDNYLVYWLSARSQHDGVRVLRLD
jgi:hypothetical protein